MDKGFSPKDLLIPGAIIVAGIILAVAIYIVRVNHNVVHGTGTVDAVRPVTPNDHFIGNPSAPVAIIEYADIDSNYAKSFQMTMEQLMTEHASDGKVVWVYRHFPLTTQHPNSATHSLAAECAASLSVPTTFFRFIDAIQAAAPGDNEFNPDNYLPIVGQFGIDLEKFKKCVNDGVFTKKVHDDYDNALATGATASPFIVLVVQGEKPRTITGAIPYSALKKIVDDAIIKSGS